MRGVLEAHRRLALSVGQGGTGDKPANFLEWSIRTFGEGITDHFMRPYSAKVWAIDPSRMSSDWIAGRVLTPSLEDVLAGASGKPTADLGPNARFGYPRHGGCEAFVAGLAALARSRGGGWANDRTLVAIDPGKKRASLSVKEPGDTGARIETIRYDHLLSCVPLPELIPLIRSVPEAIRQAASGLPTTAVTCVNLGINRADLTEKHWIYYPEPQDKFIFQRIFVQSNASPHTAPPGQTALTFEISHSPTKPLPVRGQSALGAACLDGLRRTDLWRDGDEVTFEQVLELPHAYIPFTPDRPRRLTPIHAYLGKLGIIPIGRFGEWKYLNKDGAILSGQRAAERFREGRTPEFS